MKLIFSLFFLFLTPVALGKIEPKVLPSHLQKAYIIQRQAIVYARPNFDSLQITSIPAGELVTLTKKIYRPQSNFGTFYRIYITRPKKMRAYISEIDVVPRYVQSGSGYKLNDFFVQTKKKLHHIKDFQANRSKFEGGMDLSDKSIPQTQQIGMTIAYNWMNYSSSEKFIGSWFFNLKWSGHDTPVKNIPTDLQLGFSISPIMMKDIFLKRGLIVIGEFVFKLPLVDFPYLMAYIGGGLMLKWKIPLVPSDPAIPSKVGTGPLVSSGFSFKMKERFFLNVEGKFYYDFQESRYFPSLSGGVLIGF